MNELTNRKFIPFAEQLINRDFVVKFGKGNYYGKLVVIIDLRDQQRITEYFDDEDEQTKRFDALRRIFGAI